MWNPMSLVGNVNRSRKRHDKDWVDKCFSAKRKNKIKEENDIDLTSKPNPLADFKTIDPFALKKLKRRLRL